MEVRHERQLPRYAERTAGNEFQACGSAEGVSNRGDGGTDLGLHGPSGKGPAVAQTGMDAGAGELPPFDEDVAAGQLAAASRMRHRQRSGTASAPRLDE